MIKRTKLLLAGVLLAGAAAVLTACTQGTTSLQNDNTATNNQLNTYEQNQPIPKNTWSQYRQTVIDVEQAEVHGVATTTFFYNLGSNVPVKACPSIGFPVASTAQLTNPEQIAFSNTNGGGWESGVVGQAEPNGVYTGDTTGTYVVCIGSNGDKRIDYWEGYVETEGGPAHFDVDTGQIVDDGDSTVVTKTK